MQDSADHSRGPDPTPAPPGTFGTVWRHVRSPRGGRECYWWAIPWTEARDAAEPPPTPGPAAATKPRSERSVHGPEGGEAAGRGAIQAKPSLPPGEVRQLLRSLAEWRAVPLPCGLSPATLMP